ncbi:MAG: hydroxyacid dehydrogenase [Planctomycetaceae bacterium]|nr:hydroxyacid dehydrogenase [Planctomycetaceae bacterium]
MTKVAVTDFTFPNLDLESAILEPLGCQLVAGQCKDAASLIELTADADHVITQFAPIDAEVIAAMQRADVIVRYGIGVDNVDLDAARTRGIPVCNVPDYCIEEVSDQTLAFMLGCTRQLSTNHRKVATGDWGLGTPLEQMRTLCDLVVGVAGFGRIGRAVTRRLVAFGCRVQVFDPIVKSNDIESLGAVATDWDALVKSSDVLTLHCPSTDETRGIINRETLSQMPPGAILINVARGDLVNTDALVEALQTGHLSGAALDVFDPEPLPADHPLTQLENVLLSSHIASASVKAARKLRETVAGIVAARVRGERLPNIVNGVDA